MRYQSLVSITTCLALLTLVLAGTLASSFYDLLKIEPRAWVKVQLKVDTSRLGRYQDCLDLLLVDVNGDPYDRLVPEGLGQPVGLIDLVLERGQDYLLKVSAFEFQDSDRSDGSRGKNLGQALVEIRALTDGKQILYLTPLIDVEGEVACDFSK